MARPTMMQRRDSAKYDPQVEEILEQFWDAFSESLINSRDVVHMDQVIRVNMKFIKALWPPEEWDEDEAREISQDDWEREMNVKIIRTNRLARNRMSKGEFIDSVREIAGDTNTYDCCNT
jgi:hypothetical protein